MDSESNYEAIYCDDVGEYRICCDICDKLCIERYYKNHLKSQTHTNNFYKRQRLNKNYLVFIKVNECDKYYP